MFRNVTVALMAFLTLVDLFATQAILPTLARAYHVTPAAMGLAVNASTMGMAVAGLVMALFGRRIDRRLGVALSLALLALPTAALAFAPDLITFAALRIVQGLAMSSAFALTLSYLAEHCSMAAAAGAFAAYVTGNVASNLFGRLMSAALADHLGLAGNFVVFAGLNGAGAVLAWLTLARSTPMPTAAMPRAPWSALIGHWRNRALRVSFAIGFLILFAFIGTFTYVNFVLAREPIALSAMGLGFVYFVFLPSLLTTPLAGRAVARFGAQRSFRASLAVAGIGLPLLLVPQLVAVVIGLACVGAGTFFAQATATGFVGRAATDDPGSASGMYLASYFLGGLIGAAVIGQLFQHFGWSAAVAAVGAALALAAWLAGGLVVMPMTAREPTGVPAIAHR
ncbi:MAG TPA: MFS transporter [Burkholderiaceae bacterium]|jgi:predicted MFS family arabinose efflux permease